MRVLRPLARVFTSPVCFLVWLVTVADATFTTLLPTLHERLALTTFAAAVLVSTTTAITLVVAVPIGLLVDRLGPRRLLLGAAVFTGIGTALEAVAGSFALLLAGRALFGVAFAIIWTATPALMLGSRESSAGMGRVIAAAGAGQLVGPVLAGIAAQAVGVWVPFAAIAAVAVLAVPVLARTRTDRPTGSGPEPSDPRASAATRRPAASVGQSSILGAAVLIGVLGLASSVTNLAVPLRLSDEGASPAMVGAILSAAAIVFTLTAPLAGAAVGRGISLRLVAVVLLLLGVIWVIPLGLSAPIVMAAFLMCSSACRSPLNTIVYILGRTEDATRRAAAVGTLNVVWAAASMLGPIVASTVIDRAGPQWPYAIVAVPSVLAAALLLSSARRSGSSLTVRSA
jgi:predicted MFS family arabinose efflux permease